METGNSFRRKHIKQLIQNLTEIPNKENAEKNVSKLFPSDQSL